MHTLQGVGVLVTRPEHQAAPLCRLLEAEGAVAIRLPALQIEAVGDPAEAAVRARAQGRLALLIFTSANAVRFGAGWLDVPRAPALAAIGPATARALGALGHPATIVPDGGFDSEHLLRHPDLAELTGRHVAIVTGTNGRGLLPAELRRRGAQVTVLEVYRRMPATHDPAQLAALARRFQSGEVQIVTATSAEIAANLLALAPDALRREFERAVWVVPSARVGAAVRANGMTAALLQAASAEDQDLLAAIKRWRSSASGA